MNIAHCFVFLFLSSTPQGTTMTCGSTGVQRTIEKTRAIFGCSGLGQDSSVTLTLVSQSGQMVSLGSCTRTLTCTLRHTAVSSLVRPAATFVSMELYATRAMAGRLVCSQVSSNGATDSANCDHDVVCKRCVIITLINTDPSIL